MRDIKPYTAKNGAQQFKPSAALLQELDDEGMGFCLAAVPRKSMARQSLR